MHGLSGPQRSASLPGSSGLWQPLVRWCEAEEETVELLPPVADARCGSGTGASFLSLSASASGAASRPLLAAACCVRSVWHLQSAGVVDTQIFSVRKLMNQHANATERRGHLGLKRRKSFERSAVFTAGWWLAKNAQISSVQILQTHHPNRARG